MNIRANRGVLYFGFPYDQVYFHLFSFVKTKLETPLNTQKSCQNREYPCLLLKKASFTVEAAFSGTMFFLAIFSLFYLFTMMHGLEKNLLLLDTAVTEYECFGTKLSSGKALLNGTVILWDDEDQLCYRKEKQKISLIGGNLFSTTLYQQLCTSRYEGRSMVPDPKDQSLEEYVYLAESGTVYHKSRSCIYLNPKISKVSYQDISVRRNHSGGKYYPCRRCGKQGVSSGYVFITPYGDSWHSIESCPGLKRTIRQVRLSQVGNLPACSKCGK